MMATLVGGSLHGTFLEVPDRQTPVRRLFRRDGLAWFECYEPATAHRPADGPLVFRFSVPPEDQLPAVDLTDIPSQDGERRVLRERRSPPAAGRRERLSSPPAHRL